MESQNYLINQNLTEFDTHVTELIESEEKRQHEKLIMIASESMCPLAVRQTLSSVFTNIYAEGYPSLKMLKSTDEELEDIPYSLAYYKRQSDNRYYKGCDYVNIVESLAIKRVSDLFATPEVPASHIFANVQPLSGAAANNAVYEAFVKAGDTVMGMALIAGGHLTHGNPKNRSGINYKIVSYSVDETTGQLNYDQIMELAKLHKPKMIIAGYSAYPWSADWKAFRKIANEVGAILFADISHTAGLIAAGVYPSPVGYADVVTFTTHKTLCGPRGAVILTTDEKKAKKIDMAVFPGEQGGPHINNIAAKAVAFKMGMTKEFKQLQTKVIENAKVLGEELKKLGVKLGYDGTDSHLILVDLKSINPKLGAATASKILDDCNIVTNKNTIIGDVSAIHPSAIRLGTMWLTQLGMDKTHMVKLAQLIHKVLVNIKPYKIFGAKAYITKSKIQMEIMEEVKQGVRELISSLCSDKSCDHTSFKPSPFVLLKGEADRIKPFLDEVTTEKVENLAVGELKQTNIINYGNKVMDQVLLSRIEDDSKGLQRYVMATTTPDTFNWLRGLSNGTVLFDDDLLGIIDGPAVVNDIDLDKFKIDSKTADMLKNWVKNPQKSDKISYDMEKTYFVGQKELALKEKPSSDKKVYNYVEPEEPVKRTTIYDEHVKLKGKMAPFAGHEMPLWYTSISDEHKTVRETGGLFDVSHMGSFEVSGENATRFLDIVTTNYVADLKDGQALYTYLLDINGVPMDDLIIYKRNNNRYFIVINASNADKDFKWLNAVNKGEVIIDKNNPMKRVESPVTIKNLKDPVNGKECKVDIALQGKSSVKILNQLFKNPNLSYLHKFEFVIDQFEGTEVIIARTGYTGELYSFELFIHPDYTVKLWNKLLELGKEYGIKPIGLGARDSLRTEAGLPLYGHELAGNYNISPLGAGFDAYVRFHKPFFVGREPLLKAEASRKMALIRFIALEKGARMLHPGCVIMDKRGQCIGNVTSCAVGIDGKQVGMAYIDKNYTKMDTPLGIMPAPRDKSAVSVADVKVGDRFPYPVECVVTRRFK